MMILHLPGGEIQPLHKKTKKKNKNKKKTTKKQNKPD